MTWKRDASKIPNWSLENTHTFNQHVVRKDLQIYGLKYGQNLIFLDLAKNDRMGIKA